MEKKGIALRELAWWLLGAGALVLAVAAIVMLYDKDSNMVAFVKDIFRFRRV